jgi:glycogen operon protein
MVSWPDRLLPGVPYPLGATWDGLGTNFAVFSAHATRIELCLFDPSGRREIQRFEMPECTDEVWHGYLPNARAGLIYGYRAYGPYEPQHGHRFNHHKLLLDPYARRLAGELRSSDALFGYRVNSPRADLSFDRRDSAPGMLKAVVTDDSFTWADDRPPVVPWCDTVIYEVHVRGLSMLRHDLRANERGTFAALGDPHFIDHMRRLGVTTVELLPVHAFVQDRTLLQRGLRNYWGYNTIGFFAPEPRYLSDNTLDEMRIAVRRLHAAGLEVILDVVYNHTAEGSELGPTLSFRGLDNASYYRLVADNRRHCVNDTGTGNTLNLSTPRVLQMVMVRCASFDRPFHIDGFRFDLGVTLGRGTTDSISAQASSTPSARIGVARTLVSNRGTGPGVPARQSPPGFAKWNDRFRDGVRRYWRGDRGSAIRDRLAGSADPVRQAGAAAVGLGNFVAAHGSHPGRHVATPRHNQTNGRDNKDGTGENWSANGGSGTDRGSRDTSTRGRVRRALLFRTLFLAQGAPMLLGGDDSAAQRGSNNAIAGQRDHLARLAAGRRRRGQRAHRLRRRIIALATPRGAARRAFCVARSSWRRASATRLVRGLGRTGQQRSWNNPEERLVVRRAAATAAEVSIGGLLQRHRRGSPFPHRRRPAGAAAARQRPAEHPSAASTARRSWSPRARHC